MTAKPPKLPPKASDKEKPPHPKQASTGPDVVFFSAEALSILQGVFSAPQEETESSPESKEEPPEESEAGAKTASVKFMITAQDEEELRRLGYAQAEIDRLKPQEAADIISAGTRPARDD